MIVETLILFLNAYRILILIRIILSWLVSSGINTNVFFKFIYSATEPFLSVFRRVRFFRLGMYDFSPIAALITLTIVERMLSHGDYKLSTFIVLFIIEVWGIFRSIFIALIFFFALRLIFLLFSLFDDTDFMRGVDSLLIPLSVKINNIVTDKTMSYTLNLIVADALLMAFIIIFEQAIFAISILAFYLPF
ncbi:YggT family protein [Candidatus Borreliella tachyglossi]|uniref:YggT family protein n=1 Tax=Candidatus Borreliella tachyglossi TaxID=1964448 RepID=A0A2S1LXE3_9SPIR|nr:YggT family protein [Candidatus Borreliella tachyglossi]AWG42946.1 YggT family protein [Candidatus Borreliella tachyglossi]